jgi:hypothetical protein
MPNITQYDSTSGITPSDKGIEGAELAGRRIGQFYHQLGDTVKSVGDAVENHVAVMETSEVFKTSADVEYNIRKQWEQQSAVPENRNNPHFGDLFMAQVVSPILDQWGQGVSTDRGKLLVAERKAEIRNNIFRDVAAGQSAMDFAHYQDNKLSFLNTLSAQLIDNPTQQGFTNAQALWQQFLTENTAHIPDPEMREHAMASDLQEGNTQLALARYRGANEASTKQIGETGDPTKSPAYSQTEDDIAKRFGFQYLSPELQQAVIREHDEAVQRGKELFNTADAAQRKKDSDDFDAALLPIETSLFQNNGAGGVTMAVTPQALEAVQRAAQMPGAKQHPEKIEALLNAMHTATQDKLAGKETVTDHGTFVQLSSEIGSSSNPLTTTEVDKAYAQGKLAEEDYHFLRTSAVDSKQSAPKAVHAFTELNQWLARIKPMIDKSNPLLGNLDQTGVQNFSYFSWDATQKLKQMIAAGYDPEHALTMMTDPRNPRGLYHFIPQYQVHDGKAGLKSVINSISTGKPQPIAAPPGGVDHVPPPPRAANESTDAYLKRTGG